jgi:hypothetical protein
MGFGVPRQQGARLGLDVERPPSVFLCVTQPVGDIHGKQEFHSASPCDIFWFLPLILQIKARLSATRQAATFINVAGEEGETMVAEHEKAPAKRRGLDIFRR